MKKTFYLSLIGLFLVFSFMLFNVSAVVLGPTTTYVSGKIYEIDHSSTISGANVSVECLGNFRTTVTNSDGSYMVAYNSSECFEGNTVNVVAVKGDKWGSDSGIVNNFNAEINFAVVNVTVPEFGLIVAVLTAFAGLGIFFFVKRE